MRLLNDVSLAGRWWPISVAGYKFHRNSGTVVLQSVWWKYTIDKIQPSVRK